MPIGAIVEMGGRIVSRAFTRDVSLGRRLVHADLLAMIAADEELGWYAAPKITGGIHRAQVKEQFRRYCDRAPDSGFRSWASTLATLPDR